MKFSSVLLRGLSQNVENHHRFQGQYFDSETGLHYNRFRYYDPHMARYISKDPIGLEGGMNTSAYVADPSQWVDPLGLQETYSGRIGANIALETYNKNRKNGNGIPPKLIADAVEKYATNKSLCAEAVAGVGVGAKVKYLGNGVTQTEVYRSIRLSGQLGVLKDQKQYFGERKDGRYYEVCGATGKSIYCAGVNNDGTGYADKKRKKWGEWEV